MAQEMGTADQGINERLAAISRDILPESLSLAWVSLDLLREQDVNAQSMPQKMFDQLADNIKEAGAPESVPLVARGNDERYEIISGHHRVRAARAAGMQAILCLCYHGLPRARVKSKQLAHNSIVGQSDPALVKRIWQEIDDISARFESFIDPRELDQKLKPVSVKPPDVEFQTRALLFVFLETQAQTVDDALAALPDAEADTVYVAHRQDFDLFREALARVRKDCEIVAPATAVAQMARLALAYLNDCADSDKEHTSDT
jgi:hypothetical protein